MNEIVSSRTPEGFPSHCPLCGAATNLEFSDPAGDAPCPNCGHLLWLSAQILDAFTRRKAELLGVSVDAVTAETPLVNDLGEDSLDVVGLMMELEEQFDIVIPEEDAEHIKTVGDAIRYIEQIHGRDQPE